MLRKSIKRFYTISSTKLIEVATCQFLRVFTSTILCTMCVLNKFSSPSQLAAARIIENMDPSANPCEDFYQYACGGWLQNNEIPEEDSRFGVLDGISEEVDKAVKGE